MLELLDLRAPGALTQGGILLLRSRSGGCAAGRRTFGLLGGRAHEDVHGLLAHHAVSRQAIALLEGLHSLLGLLAKGAVGRASQVTKLLQALLHILHRCALAAHLYAFDLMPGGDGIAGLDVAAHHKAGIAAVLDLVPAAVLIDDIELLALFEGLHRIALGRGLLAQDQGGDIHRARRCQRRGDPQHHDQCEDQRDETAFAHVVHEKHLLSKYNILHFCCNVNQFFLLFYICETFLSGTVQNAILTLLTQLYYIITKQFCKAKKEK